MAGAREHIANYRQAFMDLDRANPNEWQTAEAVATQAAALDTAFMARRGRVNRVLGYFGIQRSLTPSVYPSKRAMGSILDSLVDTQIVERQPSALAQYDFDPIDANELRYRMAR